MKQAAWLFLVVLCLSMLLNAEDQGSTMSGWVCDSKCAVHNGDCATCNPSGTDRSGDAVFIDDQGATFEVANPSSCTSYMNKR